MPNFKEISNQEFEELLNFWCDNPDKRRSMDPEQYLARTEHGYAVADNRAYEFFVEEFETLTEALRRLDWEELLELMD